MQSHKINIIKAILFGYYKTFTNIVYFIRIMALWMFTLVLGVAVVVGSVFSMLGITQYFGGSRIRIRDLRAVGRLISACAKTGPKCFAEVQSFYTMIWERHFLLIVAAIVAVVMIIYVSIVFILAYRRAALDIRDHGYSTIQRFMSCFYLMPKIIAASILYVLLVSSFLLPIVGILWFKYGDLLDVTIWDPWIGYFSSIISPVTSVLWFEFGPLPDAIMWAPWLRYTTSALATVAFILVVRFQFFLYRIVDVETLPGFALADSFIMTHGNVIRLLLVRLFFSAINGGLVYAYWHTETVTGLWLLLYPLFLLPSQRIAYAYIYRQLLSFKELPERKLPKRGPLA